MAKVNEQQNIELAELKEWRKGFERLYKNDMKHFKDALKRVETKMDKVIGWLFVGFIVMIAASIIAQIVLKFFK